MSKIENRTILVSHMGSSIQYVPKVFRKTNISNPLIRTRTCAYQRVRNVSFFRKFCVRTRWLAPLKLGELTYMKNRGFPSTCQCLFSNFHFFFIFSFSKPSNLTVSNVNNGRYSCFRKISKTKKKNVMSGSP